MRKPFGIFTVVASLALWSTAVLTSGGTWATKTSMTARNNLSAGATSPRF